ncbi:unnamed protein product [Orchesella dallaii]|uniref:Transmembrane protein n=1 Tax=Orchesella dallaii TaxID=48710 RepID=A0ABP1R104_9HEXA
MHSSFEETVELFDEPPFQWRRPTKMVGIIDLILSIIDCYVVILILVIATTTLHNEVWALHEDEWRVILIITGCTLLGVLISLLELWAAANLLGSTLIGRDPEKALHMATFWRYLNAIFLILLVVCVVTNVGLELTLKFSWIYMLIILIGVGSIVIRCSFFYVVLKYCEELQERCNNGAGK